MTQVQTESERLSRSEGANEHVERVLATNASVERLRTDVERLRSELKGMKWIIGVGFAAAGAIGPIVTRILS